MKLFVSLILAVIASLGTARAAAPELVNGVLAVVNDSVITYKDVQNSIRPEDIDLLTRRHGNQPDVLNQKLRDLEKERLEAMVETQLILSEFKTNPRYQLPESYIESRIEEDIRRFGDRLTMTKTLQAQGMTYESYRNKVRERIILELMWRHHVPVDPLISPAKIEKYYQENQDKFRLSDQVRPKMIVLAKRPGGPDPAALAREINAKLAEGAPFEEMAKIYSQGSQAAQGGDWGWVEKNILRQELAEAAFAMNPGDPARTITTPDAVYILQVQDKKAAHVRPLVEVRDEIEETLKSEQHKRMREQWIAGMRKKAFVRYF